MLCLCHLNWIISRLFWKIAKYSVIFGLVSRICRLFQKQNRKQFVSHFPRIIFELFSIYFQTSVLVMNNLCLGVCLHVCVFVCECASEWHRWFCFGIVSSTQLAGSKLRWFQTQRRTFPNLSRQIIHWEFEKRNNNLSENLIWIQMGKTKMENWINFSIPNPVANIRFGIRG